MSHCYLKRKANNTASLVRTNAAAKAARTAEKAKQSAI